MAHTGRPLHACTMCYSFYRSDFEGATLQYRWKNAYTAAIPLTTCHLSCLVQWPQFASVVAKTRPLKCHANPVSWAHGPSSHLQCFPKQLQAWMNMVAWGVVRNSMNLCSSSSVCFYAPFALAWLACLACKAVLMRSCNYDFCIFSSSSFPCQSDW